MFVDGKELEPSTSWSHPFRLIEFPEILTATKNFHPSVVIGSGSFGKVYKGNIIDGVSNVVAAIKRLDAESSQGPIEFWAEIKLLGRLRHRNIVSLIGYCIHEREKILVYEYMPNGTLADHLHKRRTPLSWLLRLNICIDASRGLRYLHSDVGVQSGIIHRDLKSSNILLHQSWTAKISDFGLSKICPTNQPSTYVDTRVKGSFGYFDPSYFRTGKLTRKSDVYAFGVVLLEVLCRKPALMEVLDENPTNLAAWAQGSIKDRNYKHIIDSDIRREISPKCLKEFVKIAERCLHENPEKRPTMVEVTVTLESVLALQEKFNKPLQPAGSRTIFGRMVDMILSASNGDNSGHQHRGNGQQVESSDNIADRRADSIIITPRNQKFTYSELRSITKDFQTMIGSVRLAKVFHGYNGNDQVSVKVLTESSIQGNKEFQAEVKLLMDVHHKNITSLVGYCNDNNHKGIIYEFMANGSLEMHLFGGRLNVLSWETRIQIACDAADGLMYLHYGCKPPIVHRDVKPSNILLNEGFQAKLANFGLPNAFTTEDGTRVPTVDVGSREHLDPEYYLTSQLTKKSDVYSFGIVLLELITSRSATSEGINMIEWVKSMIAQGNVNNLVDPRIEGRFNINTVSKVIELALACASHTSIRRPTMNNVAIELKNCLKAEKAYNGNPNNQSGYIS